MPLEVVDYGPSCSARPIRSIPRELHTTWIDAVNAGDLTPLLALMADDVVFLNPGQAPLGRKEFPVRFSAAHEQYRIRCISELEELTIVGELAGNRITLYRKHPDGRWLLARDANTLSSRT